MTKDSRINNELGKIHIVDTSAIIFKYIHPSTKRRYKEHLREYSIFSI